MDLDFLLQKVRMFIATDSKNVPGDHFEVTASVLGTIPNLLLAVQLFHLKICPIKTY
jgi:hypothetical protein